MNWLVVHVASGHSYFTGVALVIIAALASIRSSPVRIRITILAFACGTIAIAISSTAIPYWYYAFAAAVTASWPASRYVKKWRNWAPAAVVTVWAIAAVMEIPFHITPKLNPSTSRSMTVIGDSITAGMGDSDKSERWPSILAQSHDLTVYDLSQTGETTSSALKHAKEHDIVSPVVVLEIGGNDMLSFTSASRFARDLDALLAHLTSADRQIILFELPLPPFFHEYGRIQRSLARKYGVSLVPKRVLMSILASSGSTLDTIHLTQDGHDRMAECVWQIVRSAFPEQDSQ
jgi:acyl-CoA thioesterase-1